MKVAACQGAEAEGWMAVMAGAKNRIPAFFLSLPLLPPAQRPDVAEDLDHGTWY